MEDLDFDDRDINPRKMGPGPGHGGHGHGHGRMRGERKMFGL